MIGLTPILLVSATGPFPKASGPSSSSPSDIDQALLKKTIDAADLSLDLTNLTNGYFLVKGVNKDGQTVYFISAPSQDDQIVSEGMGYWMKIMVNLSMIEGKNGAHIKKYQEIFDGLLRGVAMMKNENGLPGWRCFYDPAAKKVLFRSNDERYSASDADIYIAWSLVIAQSLVDAGVWKRTDIDYGALAKDMLSRIKGLEVVKLSSENNAVKYVLKVSDTWGVKDIKGYVTVNPSYGILSAFADFARFDSSGKAFWLKLRKDTFDVIGSSESFTETLVKKARAEAVDSGDGTVRISYKSVITLLSMLAKITPSSNAEKDSFKAAGIEYNNNAKNPYFDIIHDPKYMIINKDGTWTINKKTFDFMLVQIESHNVKLFFPDQVEVGVDEKGRLNVRPEAAAFNLDFTENYDAIRVYKELGEDLLLNDDSQDPFVPQQYRISAREAALLRKMTAGKDPLSVRAGKYNNVVATACYFMAAQDSDRSKFEKALLTDKDSNNNSFWFQPGRENKPQYYHASLATLTASGYLAGDAKKGLKITDAKTQIKEFIAKKEESELPPYLFGLDSPSLDYLIKSTVNTGKNMLGEGVPEYKLQAERRYHHFEDMYKQTPNDPEVIYLYAQSLLGIGAYHEARTVLFEAMLKMVKPEKEASAFWDFATDGSDKAFMQCVAERTNVKEQRMMGLCAKLYSDISRTLNIDEYLTGDDMDWILDNKLGNPANRLTLRASLINKLNIKGRTTEALEEEIKFLEEYNRLYGKTPMGCGTAESAMGLLYSGENLRTPIPRIDILASVASEFVVTFSNMYKLGAADNNGYQERIYYSADAIKLADALLSGTPLPSPDKKFNYIVSLIQPFEAEISAAGQTRLLTAKARAQLQSVYNTMDSINARRVSYQSNQEEWNLSQKDPEHLADSYVKLIKECDESITSSRQALSSLLSDNVNDKEAFSVIFDNMVSANLAKIPLINKLSLHLAPYGIKPEKFLGGEQPATLIKGLSDEVIKLYTTVLNTFQNPLKGMGNQLLPIRPSTDSDENIKRAAAFLVDSSADPRNANYISWMLKAIDAYSMIGEKTAGIGPSENSETMLKDSLEICLRIPQVYVSNDEQRALFLFRALLGMEDIIYFNGSQIKASNDEQVKTLRNDAMLLFKTLVGKSLSEGDDIKSPQAKLFLKSIQENRAEINKIFLKNPTFKAIAYAKYGNFLWWSEDAKNRTGDAKEAYENALSIDPYNADALVGKANCLLLETPRKENDILTLTVRVLRVAAISPDPKLIKSISSLLTQVSSFKSFSGEDKAMVAKAAYLFSSSNEVDPATISEVLEIFKDLVR